jgi:transcriptional regulator with XRE-family HTH domain
MAPPTQFGRLLRRLREAAGLTQVELARRAKLSPNCVGALERGERQRPQPHTRRKLAVALGLSDDELVHLLHGVAGGGKAGDRERAPAQPTSIEQAAAWELYVELVTRIAVAELAPGKGILREALTSLYSLFATVRGILRKYGAEVARPNGEGAYALACLTTTMLDEVLRPVLSEWHPRLLDHEGRRPPGTSATEHERAWARNEELRQVLAETRAKLGEHARKLAGIAGVPHPLAAAL